MIILVKFNDNSDSEKEWGGDNDDENDDEGEDKTNKDVHGDKIIFSLGPNNKQNQKTTKSSFRY